MPIAYDANGGTRPARWPVRVDNLADILRSFAPARYFSRITSLRQSGGMGMNQWTRFVACGVLCTTLVAASAPPKLVITEIMYDPLSPESDDQQTEWVEIHNVA